VYLFYWALFSEPAVIRRSLAGRFSLLGVGSFGGLGAAVLPLRWCSGGPCLLLGSWGVVVIP